MQSAVGEQPEAGTITGPQIATNAAAPRRRRPVLKRGGSTRWTGQRLRRGAQGRKVLPAAPATVAAFLTAGAQTLGAGALGRRAAAIAAKHRHRGLASPVTDSAVKAVLRDVRRTAMPVDHFAAAAGLWWQHTEQNERSRNLMSVGRWMV